MSGSSMSYRIVKESRRYSIVDKDSGSVATVKYRLPQTDEDSYPAEDLTPNDLLLAVMGMYYRNNADLTFEGDEQDKAILAARVLSVIMNERSGIVRRAEEKASERVKSLEARMVRIKRIADGYD